MNELSSKERIIRQARGLDVDRIPSIGGWINGPQNLAEIAGITIDKYLANPMAGVIKANKALGVDGMVLPVVPNKIDEIRADSVQDSHFANIEPEALVTVANSYPDTEREILAKFDYNYWELYYRNYFLTAFKTWEGIEPIPNFWEMSGPFPLYNEFGYTAFLMACALYPKEVGKIWWARSIENREQAKILAKLYKYFDLVPLMFCGQDICDNKGPMVDPEFLREYYFPLHKMIIEPLVSEGIRLVHHCDGKIIPIIDDFINVGFSGLQGFQYELGVDPYELKKRKSLLGEELIFFAGLSVTHTMPFGTIEDVIEEVDYLIDYTDGGKGMFLFTSNVIGVEVPVENTKTAYKYIKEWQPGGERKNRKEKWPWGLKHSIQKQ